MDNSQLYIEKYKQLEAVVRKTYGLPEQDSIEVVITSSTSNFTTSISARMYFSMVHPPFREDI